MDGRRRRDGCKIRIRIINAIKALALFGWATFMGLLMIRSEASAANSEEDGDGELSGVE